MFKPKVMVLGHSFVRRLHADLEGSFDRRAAPHFNLDQCAVRLFGVGGRTVQKLRQHDWKNICRYGPDIIILEIGTNDLAVNSPEIIGSQIDDLVADLIQELSVRVVGVCGIIPRADESMNQRAKVVNQYVDVVLGDKPNVFVWHHRGLLQPKQNVLLADGVHLNPHGQYRLYRSYRGAIIHALKLYEALN